MMLPPEDKAERTKVVFDHAVGVIGDEDDVSLWMRRLNVFLGNKSPLDLVQTVEGFTAVETYLTQVEYGLYIYDSVIGRRSQSEP